MGYPIGPGQLTRNPDAECDTPAEWILHLRFSITNSKLVYAWNVGGTGHCGSYLEIYAGRYYQVELTIEEINFTGLRVRIGLTLGPVMDTVGTHKFIIISGADSHGGAWNFLNFVMLPTAFGGAADAAVLDNVLITDLGDGLAFIQGFSQLEGQYAQIYPAAGGNKVYRVSAPRKETNMLFLIDPNEF